MKPLFQIISVLTLFAHLLIPSTSFAHGGSHEKEKNNVSQTVSAPEGVSLNLEFDETGNVVGKMNPFVGRLIDPDGEAMDTPIDVDLTILHLEDDLAILKTHLTYPRGNLRFQNQFFDGSEHKLKLRVRSGSGAALFPSFVLERIIEVTAIDPPMNVVLKTLLLLAGIILFGVLVGLAAGKSLANRSAPNH